MLLLEKKKKKKKSTVSRSGFVNPQVTKESLCFLTIMQFTLENVFAFIAVLWLLCYSCYVLVIGNCTDGFLETVAKLRDPPWVYRSIPQSVIGKCKILHNLHFNTS